MCVMAFVFFVCVCDSVFFQVLRVISDILENRDLVVHARLWKSPKTMRTAAQLATHCWLDEEVRLDGARVPGQGVVCNLIDPLGNHVWPIDAVAQVNVGGGKRVLRGLPGLTVVFHSFCRSCPGGKPTRRRAPSPRK